MDRSQRKTVRECIALPVSTAPTVFLATSEGLVVIDTIAIERAVNGSRKGWTLTHDEAWYAARIMLDHGVQHSIVSARVGVNVNTLRTWFPNDVPAVREPARCGTPRGYQAHHRRKESPCTACRAANTAADRYYRLHGTRIGAPTVEVAA